MIFSDEPIQLNIECDIVPPFLGGVYENSISPFVGRSMVFNFKPYELEVASGTRNSQERYAKSMELHPFRPNKRMQVD
jgi:hypothetical protein